MSRYAVDRKTRRCSGCGKRLGQEVKVWRGQRCVECRREYQSQWRQEYAKKMGKQYDRLMPRDRMQIQAFRSYYRCFLVNLRCSPVEAFMRAICHTDDLHTEAAVKQHPEIVDQWEHGEFENMEANQRYDRMPYEPPDRRVRVSVHCCY